MGPSLHDAPSDDEYVYTCGRIDDWEHVRYGSPHVSTPRTHTHQEENPYPHGCRHVCLPRTHTHQERLRDDLKEPIHTSVPLGIITTLVAPVAGRPRDHY